MHATNIIAKLTTAEQQAIQQYFRMELMKKLKSRIVVAGIVKETSLIEKPRENGEPICHPRRRR
jgi:hypothetical protein